MITRALLSKIQHGTTDKVLNELAVDFRDPARVARLLENATPQEKLAILTLLKQQLGAAGAGSLQALPQVRTPE